MASRAVSASSTRDANIKWQARERLRWMSCSKAAFASHRGKGGVATALRIGFVRHDLIPPRYLSETTSDDERWRVGLRQRT